MHCGSSEYEDGHKLKIEKEGGAFLSEARAQKGLQCCAWMDGKYGVYHV